MKINKEKFIEWLERNKRASEMCEDNAVKRRDYLSAMDEKATIDTFNFIIEQLTDNVSEQDFWEDE